VKTSFWFDLLRVSTQSNPHRSTAKHPGLRAMSAVFLAIYLNLAWTVPALAVNASALLSGRVTHNGAAVANVQVTATGNNSTSVTKTDADGRFRFPPLTLGTYRIEASSGTLQAIAQVDLAPSGASITLALTNVKQIGVVTVNSGSTVRGSGSDVVLNSKSLTQMPYANSFDGFAQAMLQLPGAAQGANGVVHMNGDHGVIDYQLDGVMLPQELNRDLGSEINLNDLSYVNLIEGAYPAQYGLKFGSVFNLQTRAGSGPPGLDGNFSYGSYGTVISTLGYHSPLAGGGGYDIAFTGSQTDRGLDPPDFNSPHNDASSTSQFAHFTLPAGTNDYTDLTLIHSMATFQIPNDVEFGEPATTDDNEDQEDLFISAQFHHAIGDVGAWNFGPAFKSSRIQDFGDPQGDWAYGEALNLTPPPFGNGGSSTDCANAASVYTPASGNQAAFLTACGYSLNDDRTSLDSILQGDFTRSYGNHNFQTGVTYDNTRVLKYYAVTLQPDNFLAPLVTPAMPDAPTTVIDNAPNLGNTYSAYGQDSWRIDPLWETDYGLRYDFFNIKSTSFDEGFGGVSPRFKLTRLFGNRASMYAYIGRFFEPPSFENVSPQAAYLLNIPVQCPVYGPACLTKPAAAEYDLTPERDTDLELGGHLPVGSGDLGLRVWQKNANDLIDDTQVGVTLLHQDINYVLGRLSQEAINYTEPVAGGGRAYFAVAHVISLNSGCETQLLAPCEGAPTGFTPADHEQRWTINGGVLLPDRHSGWFSADTYYGSGLSSAYCSPSYIFCKETPHTIFDVEKGVSVGHRSALYFDISNLLNDRYYVTLLNAQGNHYAAPRTFTMGLRFNP
jgi:TonB dependent receptor/Carboxypeptidase regulatory-like domain